MADINTMTELDAQARDAERFAAIRELEEMAFEDPPLSLCFVPINLYNVDAARDRLIHLHNVVNPNREAPKGVFRFFKLPRELRNKVYGLVPSARRSVTWPRALVLFSYDGPTMSYARDLPTMSRQFRAEFEEEVRRDLTVIIWVDRHFLSGGVCRNDIAIDLWKVIDESHFVRFAKHIKFQMKVPDYRGLEVAHDAATYITQVMGLRMLPCLEGISFHLAVQIADWEGCYFNGCFRPADFFEPIPYVSKEENDKLVIQQRRANGEIKDENETAAPTSGDIVTTSGESSVAISASPVSAFSATINIAVEMVKYHPVATHLEARGVRSRPGIGGGAVWYKAESAPEPRCFCGLDFSHAPGR